MNPETKQNITVLTCGTIIFGVLTTLGAIHAMSLPPPQFGLGIIGGMWLGWHVTKRAAE